MKKLFVLFLVLSGLYFASAQQTATFTNGSGDNQWGNPDNWDTGEVPGYNTIAVIPADQYAYQEHHPIVAGSIINHGDLAFKDDLEVHTNSLTNNGSLVVTDNKIQGINNGEVTVANSGTIEGVGDVGGNLVISRASSFSNSGGIYVDGVAVFANSILNNTGGTIEANVVNLQGGVIANNGNINASGMVFGIAGYVYNRGNINSENGSVGLWAKNDYVRNIGTGKITSTNGTVDLAGKKTDVTGQVKVINRSEEKIQDQADIEFAFDEGWVVGDTAKIRGETIRFIFNYLSFIGLDSIMDVYAGSKIEFYGTAGATLNLEWNHVQNSFWVENGTVEIHCDYIEEPDEELEYLFHPDPIIGPSDTTLIFTKASSVFTIDSAGSTGSFKLYVMNTGTGHRAFDYAVSSDLGWVISGSGNTPNLAPFNYDSLEVNYEIPLSGDTLTDEVMLVLSVPGEYIDTTYSYIRSYPAMNVRINQHPHDDKSTELKLVPNPFVDKVSLSSDRDGEITLFDMAGKRLHSASLQANKPMIWIPQEDLNAGIILVSFSDGYTTSSAKLLYLEP